MSASRVPNSTVAPLQALAQPRRWCALVAACVLCAASSPLLAQPATAQPPARSSQSAAGVTPKAHPHKKPMAAKVEAAPVEPAKPPEPEKPNWPANNAPAQPSVTWDSQGLRIEAQNSSLRQILNQVATTTGAKVEGIGSDERVFGDYGPGPARDVLSQLLHGSSYNVLMLGDQGQGTPREVILSARTKGSPQQQSGAMYQQPAPVQDDEPEQPEPEEPQPQQIIRPPMGQPANQPGTPMTPQERLMQMQQQQMQMQQQPNQPVVPLPQQPPDQ